MNYPGTHAPATEEYLRRHGLAHGSSVMQAKSTGGMIALYPRQADLEHLLVDGSSEKADDIHCTVIYFGEDVRDQDPTEIISKMDDVVGNFTTIEANIFAHAIFNPDGDEPCSVYLVGGSDDLTPLFRELKSFVESRYPDAATQHDPWYPHITAGYDLPVDKLSYTGPITFDRIGLRWPGHDDDWKLT